MIGLARLLLFLVEPHGGNKWSLASSQFERKDVRLAYLVSNEH